MRHAACALVFLAIGQVAVAQEGLTGTSSSVYQDQRAGDRSTSNIQEAFTLNYNAPVSPDWRTSWYSNVLWRKDSELEYPDLRPFVGASLFSEEIRLYSTFSYIQDRNFKDGTATLETTNWAASAAFQPKHLPSVLFNYNLTATQDDLSPHEIDVERMSRSVRLSDRILDALDFYYMHTDAVDTNNAAVVAPAILFQLAAHVAVDATGAVYVVDQNGSSVLKFNSAGGFILSWGSPGTGPGQFNSPTGIAVDPVGNVYVADSFSARIQKFDGNGNFILEWGTPGAGNSQFNNPAGLAADLSGVYVADRDNNRIQKFDFNGGYLLQWGTVGPGLGQFVQPEGIASDGTNVFVADTANHRVQRFDILGAGALAWGSFGAANGLFSSPRGIAADGAGFVYVADTGNNRIQRFTTGGAYVSQWGTAGSGDGQFATPIGIAVDTSFNLFVADSGNDRIQRFQTNGTFLTSWGNGTAPSVGESHRRSHSDSVGGSFMKTYRNVLTIGSTFGLDRTASDGTGTLGETIGTNYWIAPTLGIKLLRDVNLSYNFLVQDQETSVASASTKRLTQNHNATVSFVPFTGVLGAVSYYLSSVSESQGVDVVTQGPSATASMKPLRFMSLNLGVAESRSEVEGLAPTISYLYTASSNVTIYHENTLTASYSRSESEARETDTTGSVDTFTADVYLLPWRTLRVTERSSVSFSTSESPLSSSDSESWSTLTTVSWLAAEGTTLSSALTYSASIPGTGPRVARWSDMTSLSFAWRANSFYLFHSLVHEESTTQLVGTSLRIAVAQSSTVGLFAQRNVGGGGGDRVVRVDFTVSF